MTDQTQELTVELLRRVHDDIRDLRTGIARVHDRIDAMQNALSDQRESVGRLHVKSSVWGAAAGLLPAVGVVLWTLLK